MKGTKLKKWVDKTCTKYNLTIDRWRQGAHRIYYVTSPHGIQSIITIAMTSSDVAVLRFVEADIRRASKLS